MKKIASVFFVSLLMVGTAARADVIEPGGEAYSGYDCAGGEVMPADGSCGPGTSFIMTWLDNNVPGFGDLDELYKNDVGEGEGGTFVSLFDADLNGEGGVMSFSGSSNFQMNWLLVKDGQEAPIWYLFDISGWDPAASDLFLQNFWPGQGAISHVSVYGVPEPSVLALFGLGLLGIGISRRRRDGLKA